MFRSKLWQRNDRKEEEKEEDNEKIEIPPEHTGSDLVCESFRTEEEPWSECLE